MKGPEPSMRSSAALSLDSMNSFGMIQRSWNDAMRLRKSPNGSFSLPPVFGVPSPPAPEGDAAVPGVLSLLLLLLQPTSAIAPADAPPTAAICRARLRLIRCAVIWSQYEAALVMVILLRLSSLS